MPDPGLLADGTSAPLSERFLTDVLRSLVRVPSVNPGTPESGVAEVIAEWLAPTAAEVEFVDFADGRTSVGARLRGGAKGPTLLLNGHTDTVPLDDLERWERDPFGGEVEDGRLFGRGAADMKGGLATQIAVAHALAPRMPQLRGDIVLHFAAGEERGEPGTASLLEAGFVGDFGIVTEPTGLDVSTATRGVTFLKVTVRGRSAHAGVAHTGINPIGPLASVLAILGAYDERLRSTPHPLLPGASLTPTMLTAGVVENAVPDTCEIILDRRLLPAESGEAEAQRISELLAPAMRAFDGTEIEVRPMLVNIEGAEIPADTPLALRLAELASATTGRPSRIYGSPFGSDVRNLVRDAGMLAVTFGPGSVDEAHTTDESVPIVELSQAARTLEAFAVELLSGSGSAVGTDPSP